jgi:hypothetical protein
MSRHRIILVFVFSILEAWPGTIQMVVAVRREEFVVVFERGGVHRALPVQRVLVLNTQKYQLSPLLKHITSL